MVFASVQLGSVMGVINPLNAELNRIFHFLALLGAHHILHVSRIRVNRNVIERCWARRLRQGGAVAVFGRYRTRSRDSITQKTGEG
jgi:hypothetical protein